MGGRCSLGLHPLRRDEAYMKSPHVPRGLHCPALDAREVSWFGSTSRKAVRTSVPVCMGGPGGSCVHGHPGHGQCSLLALPTPSQPSEGARRT